MKKIASVRRPPGMAIRFVALFLTMAALGVVAAPAHAATFMPETCGDGGCPGDLKFYNSSANHNVTSFVGSVGAEHGGPAVTVDTFVGTDTGAGYATIKPHTAGTLDELLFTPANPLAYSDFSFRGQIERAGFSDALTVTVIGCLNVGGVCHEETPQTINLTTDAGPDADFSRLGIYSTTPGETIFSVMIQTAQHAYFKEFKQVDFSPAGGGSATPEPATWALMLMGVAGVGAISRRRRREYGTGLSRA